MVLPLTRCMRAKNPAAASTSARMQRRRPWKHVSKESASGLLASAMRAAPIAKIAMSPSTARASIYPGCEHPPAKLMTRRRRARPSAIALRDRLQLRCQMQEPSQQANGYHHLPVLAAPDRIGGRDAFTSILTWGPMGEFRTSQLALQRLRSATGALPRHDGGCNRQQ